MTTVLEPDRTVPSQADANPVASVLVGLLSTFLPSATAVKAGGIVAALLFAYTQIDAIKGVVGSFTSPPVAPVEDVPKVTLDDVAKVANSVSGLSARVDELESKLTVRLDGITAEVAKTKSDAPTKQAASKTKQRLKAPVEVSRELPIH